MGVGRQETCSLRDHAEGLRPPGWGLGPATLMRQFLCCMGAGRPEWGLGRERKKKEIVTLIQGVYVIEPPIAMGLDRAEV